MIFFHTVTSVVAMATLVYYVSNIIFAFSEYFKGSRGSYQQNVIIYYIRFDYIKIFVCDEY